MILNNIHPGEVLLEEFMRPLNLSVAETALKTNIDLVELKNIIAYKKEISANSALKLSKFFSVSAKFWLGLQNDFDLEEQGKQLGEDLNKIKPLVYNSI